MSNYRILESLKFTLMKKLLFVLFTLALALPTFAQNNEVQFYKKLSTVESVHPAVKHAAYGLSENYWVRDSMFVYARKFETSVLSGKSAGPIKPAMVNAARDKYPTNSVRSVYSRLKFYVVEGKK